MICESGPWEAAHLARPGRYVMERYMAVFGSCVRDVMVDVDLPVLYRFNPNVRQVIRFHGNDPIIRRGSRIRVQTTGTSLARFDVVFAEYDDNKYGLEVGGQRYYKLVGGKKYDLSNLGNKAEPPGDLEFPCQSQSWGGGGINLVTACRGISGKDVTPITYIDVAQLAQNALFKWASLAGERAYRGIAKFAEIFDPVEYVELFLAQREIRAVMLRQATGPTPVNLVFS